VYVYGWKKVYGQGRYEGERDEECARLSQEGDGQPLKRRTDEAKHASAVAVYRL
jgi:hypothetical protein